VVSWLADRLQARPRTGLVIGMCVVSSVLGRLGSFLACGDTPEPADLIVALAGRESRKDYALSLYRQSFAPRMLLSTGRFELRRFSQLAVPEPVDLIAQAASIPPPQRHFFVSFTPEGSAIEWVPLRRPGTLEEVQALAGWLRSRPAIRSVLIITSPLHLRRVRLCCRALFPGPLLVRLVGVPQERPDLSSGLWSKAAGAGDIPREIVKLLGYKVLLAVARLRLRIASVGRSVPPT
jgi:hypothetical protein